MEAGLAKKKILEAMNKLAPDATVEDAIERLYFLAKVEKGLQQAAAGKTIPHDRAKQRILGGSDQVDDSGD